MLSWSLMRCLSAVLMVVALVAACGGDDEPAGRSEPTLTSPSDTTSPTSQDEKELRKLANDWYEAELQLIAAGVPNPARAARYLTGEFEVSISQTLQRYSDEGVRVLEDPRGRTSHRIDQIVVEGDRATLTECFVDANRVIRRRDNSVINDEVVTRLSETQAIRTDDGWRLASRRATREWQGVAGCAKRSG